MIRKAFIAIPTLLAALACAAAPARAQTDFYKGKVLTLLIGVPAGGTVDLVTRLMAKHLADHIPGHPTVVPQNMVGAGGIVMANYLTNVAPHDGTYLAVLPDTLVVSQAVGVANIRFDTSKFEWIGSATPKTHSVMMAWHTSGITTIEQARHMQLLAGASSKGAHLFTVPATVNEFLGTQIKIITGYQGVGSTVLAMERGELNAVGTTWEEFKIQKPDFVRDGKVSVLVQNGPKAKDLPNVPTMQELAANDEDRQAIALALAGEAVGRPLAAPPGTPPERLAILRAAFDEMTKSADFIRDAQAVNFEVAPIGPNDIAKIVAGVLATPKSAIDRARKIVE